MMAFSSESPQASGQAHNSVSTTNSQIDFAKLKTSFFSQACSCGSTDGSDFSYITDNEDGEIMMRECKKCSDTIGLDDSTYDEVLSWMADSENIRVSICDCGNEDPDTFVFELLGDDTVLRCGKCRKTVPVSNHDTYSKESVSVSRERYTKESCVVTKQSESMLSCCDVDPPHCEYTCLNSSTSPAAFRSFGCSCVGRPCGRTKIEPTSAWKLNPGDHIAWHRPFGYWHHAIVVRCSKFDYTYVRVIQYSIWTTSMMKIKAEIVENWIDMWKKNGDFYRLEYKPEAVFSSDEVIERGRKRLREVQYNLYSNNCEHFARWCKTGVGKSGQVKSLTTAFKRTIVSTGAQVVVSLIAKDAPKRWLGQAMSNLKPLSGKFALPRVSAPSSAAVCKIAGRELTRRQICSVAAGAAAFTVIVGIEVYLLYSDMKTPREQHRNGDISHQKYINILVKRSGRAIGAVVGATVWSFVPIPVVSTLIGSTLESLVGEMVGALAGKYVSSLIAVKVKSCDSGKMG